MPEMANCDPAVLLTEPANWTEAPSFIVKMRLSRLLSTSLPIVLLVPLVKQEKPDN
jgi:hypothetical protein